MSTAVTATGEKLLTSAELRALSVRSNLPGIIRAASHYGAIAVVGTLIWQIASTYGLLWAMPLIVVQGYFVAFLFMVVHETAHKTAFRSRAINLVLGHLSSFAIGLPYEYYCLFHWDTTATPRIRSVIRNCWSARCLPRIRSLRSLTPVFGRSPFG